MTVRRVRDAKLKCPMCTQALKTDSATLWCENAECEFHGLYGELVYDGKLKVSNAKGYGDKKPYKRRTVEKGSSRQPHKLENAGSNPAGAIQEDLL